MAGRTLNVTVASHNSAGRSCRHDALRYSALNSIGNVACVCARCCGRRPNSTTRPGLRSIETTAARPAISSSPFSQPDASTFVFGYRATTDAGLKLYRLKQAYTPDRWGFLGTGAPYTPRFIQIALKLYF